MISIHGSTSYREYKHAMAFADLVRVYDPSLDTSGGAHLHIIAPVRTPGQRRSETDFGVLAHFDPPMSHRAPGGEVAIHSFFTLIEVKDTPHVVFDVTALDYVVTYSDGTSDEVLRQSREQLESVLEYGKARKLPMPFVTNFVWLRQTEATNIRPDDANVFGRGLTFRSFLDRLITINTPRRWSDGTLHLQRNDGEKVRSLVEELRRPPPQTRLDRKRIDALTSSELPRAWHADVGRQQVILSGRGGSGKTFALLERAVRITGDDPTKRVVILTYNHALVSDLQRQLYILEDSGRRINVDVRNVHHFLLGVAANWRYSIPRGSANFEDAYRDVMKSLAAEFRDGRIANTALQQFMSGNARDYAFDYVFIDEGQDWLDSERDVLHTMYPAGAFVVAVGRDQLVRRRSDCDWAAAAPRATRPVTHLTKCLRMGAALAGFVNDFAVATGVDSWKVKESTTAAGGDVIILEGELLKEPKHLQRLISLAVDVGNKPIDVLCCLPPFHHIDDLDRHSATELVARVHGWGLDVWDGTDPDVRKIVPWSDKQVRFVQYPSSRGLEGFSVVNVAIDRFYDWKYAEWQDEDSRLIATPVADQHIAASRFAAAWSIIPLTRAIHTLVLNVGSRTTPLGTILWDLHHQLEGVQWHKL